MDRKSPAGEPPPPVGTAQVREDAVHLSGEFDCANVHLVREAVQQVAARRPGFLIDLTDVTYLDSSGVAVFMEFVQLRPRLLVQAGSVIEQVLTITGLAELGLVEAAGPDPN